MSSFESDYKRMEEEFLSIRAEIGYLKATLDDRNERLTAVGGFRSRRVAYTRKSLPLLLLGKDQAVEPPNQLARLIAMDRFVFANSQS
ncbi:hypothetical protein [Pseudogemmobacter sp. W21_MBD1_M6]|uniref:hypothetical protein n=1 Tax=Pseudogemmobacter sp. W21_MBD1_M6 TaxID=3240271 RepID=UPI003F9E5BF4